MSHQYIKYRDKLHQDPGQTKSIYKRKLEKISRMSVVNLEAMTQKVKGDRLDRQNDNENVNPYQFFIITDFWKDLSQY